MRNFLTPDTTHRRVLHGARDGARGVEIVRATCESARLYCLKSGAGVEYLATEAATLSKRRAHVEDEMSWNFEADGGTRAQHKRLFCDDGRKARLTLPRQGVPGIHVRRFRPGGKAI
jgi:hypothetical protein